MGELTTTSSEAPQSHTIARFPTCEDHDISDKEKKMCADEKMLINLYKRLRYPRASREAGIQGQAIFQFSITAVGKIENIKILNGLSPDITNECIKLISKFPDFIPAHVDGEPVRSEFILPIGFKIKN